MAENGGQDHGPLHQFEIAPLFGGTDIVPAGESVGHALSFYTFTNSSLAMLVGVVAVTLTLSLGVRRAQLVPTRLQSLAEISYEFIANMIRDNVGSEGRKYFGFIFTLFMFVFAGNMLGMVPYSPSSCSSSPATCWAWSRTASPTPATSSSPSSWPRWSSSG
jgi:F-type H+-transporting ATPase subunit a